MGRASRESRAQARNGMLGDVARGRESGKCADDLLLAKKRKEAAVVRVRTLSPSTSMSQFQGPMERLGTFGWDAQFRYLVPVRLVKKKNRRGN